jgi:hypothetical protein
VRARLQGRVFLSGLQSSRCLSLVFVGRTSVGPGLVFRPTPAQAVLASVPIMFKSATAPVLSTVFVFGFPSPTLIIAV